MARLLTTLRAVETYLEERVDVGDYPKRGHGIAWRGPQCDRRCGVIRDGPRAGRVDRIPSASGEPIGQPLAGAQHGRGRLIRPKRASLRGAIGPPSALFKRGRRPRRD
jgi:hypothetical protein